MPRNRKYFVHNTPVFVTSRMQEGLPLVPTYNLNTIIWGILARAQTLYPATVCHFLFMANHFHMLLVVDDPAHVPAFIGYLKAEISHAVNILLGRKQRTLWVAGYDSPTILTPDDVLRYIQYTYANPASANLTDSIDLYPGVSSWPMFLHDSYAATHKHISRDAIPQLPYAALTINEQKRIRDSLLDGPGTEESFFLNPFAWMKCFPELRETSQESMKKKILELIELAQGEARAKRVAEKKSVVGATALRRQSMLKEHEPEKFARKMICICSDKELRVRFIEHFKHLCNKAAEAYERWKLGEVELRLPAGILAPCLPTLMCEIIKVT